MSCFRFCLFSTISPLFCCCHFTQRGEWGTSMHTMSATIAVTPVGLAPGLIKWTLTLYCCYIGCPIYGDRPLFKLQFLCFSLFFIKYFFLCHSAQLGFFVVIPQHFSRALKLFIFIYLNLLLLLLFLCGNIFVWIWARLQLLYQCWMSIFAHTRMVVMVVALSAEKRNLNYVNWCPRHSGVCLLIFHQVVSCLIFYSFALIFDSTFWLLVACVNFLLREDNP